MIKNILFVLSLTAVEKEPVVSRKEVVDIVATIKTKYPSTNQDAIFEALQSVYRGKQAVAIEDLKERKTLGKTTRTTDCRCRFERARHKLLAGKEVRPERVSLRSDIRLSLSREENLPGSQ